MAGGTAVLLLGVAAWLAWSRAEGPAPVAAPPPAAEPAQAPTPEAPAALGLDAEEGRAELAEALEGMPRPGALGEVAARSYRERARFPPWTEPIRNGVDPLLRDRTVTPGHSFPRDVEPALWAEPAAASFEAPGPVILRARLVEDGGLVPARSIEGEIRTQAGEVVGRLDFRDHGSEGDESAGDLVYTAHLPGARAEGLAGSYLVQVDALTREGAERTAVTGFLYSAPASQLTGRFRDEVVDGNLVIEAELEVLEESRFHLEGTVGARGGEPLAWAQNATSLPPGRHWLPLTFYGLALRESGRDGPYRLLSVGLSTTGTMPNHPNDLVRNAHVTEAYRADRFTSQSFGDPGLLGAARQLEGAGGADAGLDAGAPALP